MSPQGEDENQRTLSRIAIFDGLSNDTLERLESRCKWRHFQPNRQIIDSKDDSRDVFFITEGVVRVVNYSVSGREISFEDLTAGSIFGELAALDGEPRSASVVAVAETVVATMSPNSFCEMLKDEPMVALRLMQRLSRIIRTSVDRIMDLSTLGANNRVYAEVLRLAQPADGNMKKENGVAIIAPVPIHSDIASRVSTTRETVARVFSDLSRKGIVERAEDCLKIHDLDRLRDMVEEFRGD